MNLSPKHDHRVPLLCSAVPGFDSKWICLRHCADVAAFAAWHMVLALVRNVRPWIC